MAIYQRGKSWYYDFVHKGQRYTGCFGPVSRTVAKEELARKKAEVIEGRLNPNKAKKSLRFEAFAEEYLEWSKANKKPTSYQRTVGVMKHLTATFGTKKLNELTPWHIEQYKKARKETGLAPVTINLEVTLLKGMLNKARTWGKLTENPGKEVKLLKGVKERIRFLSEEEEVQILSACQPSLRRLVPVGLLTGFRRQELTSLRPQDVDLEQGTVSVAACYSKNGESRTLPLSPRLKALLKEALETSREAPTVFVTKYGKP
jgi:integrase